MTGAGAPRGIVHRSPVHPWLIHRWLMRRGVMGLLALAVGAAIVLFQWPVSPAAGEHFRARTGRPPFDERPAGYRLSEAMADFRALGPQGLADYEAYRALDIVFPCLLCALVAGVMLRLEAARATAWAWLAAGVDTAENVALYALLLTRADPAPRLVQWASGLTQAKFACYAIMLGMLLAAGLRFTWRRRRHP